MTEWEWVQDQLDKLHAEFDAAEAVLVNAQGKFSPRSTDNGLRMLWRAQYHVNRRRVEGSTAIRAAYGQFPRPTI